VELLGYEAIGCGDPAGSAGVREAGQAAASPVLEPAHAG
jgi:hypothetical protein